MAFSCCYAQFDFKKSAFHAIFELGWAWDDFLYSYAQ
jgi:hypothetical protein